MACISPDGKPTATGFRILRALNDGLGSPEAIAEGTDVPLFKVRSGLREMEIAGLVSVQEGKYQLASKGKELADTPPV
jgi:DNA-binding IclR family transcriptional regulator